MTINCAAARILRLGLLGIMLALGALLSAVAADNSDTPGQRAVLLTIEGPIGPATSGYVVHGLEEAAELGAAVVILQMDTPGGLDTAMREIIRAILASPVPVISYVSPSGARAASAGTYISYAAHVAAMAPGTNLGAATPVQVGAMEPLGGDESKDEPDDENVTPDDKEEPSKDGKDDAKPDRTAGMKEKMVNDAVAYIRSLAQLRERNVEWAEKAVSEAASLSADDALEQGVIDLIAEDVPSLLAATDGRKVTLDNELVTLRTADLAVDEVEPGWRTKLLAVITNPNVASILMLIGVYGLILEFYSPGLVGPGVIGSISLLLALYAFHVLPVDYAGVALMLLGIALMVAEMFLPSFGIIGLGGVAAFVFGTIMLIDETDAPGMAVSLPLVGGIGIALGTAVVLLAITVMRSRRDAVVSGPEQMIGSPATVVNWDGLTGTVRTHGEMWRARSATSLTPGSSCRVTGLDGLTVVVTAGDTD